MSHVVHVVPSQDTARLLAAQFKVDRYGVVPVLLNSWTAVGMPLVALRVASHSRPSGRTL